MHTPQNRQAHLHPREHTHTLTHIDAPTHNTNTKTQPHTHTHTHTKPHPHISPQLCNEWSFFAASLTQSLTLVLAFAPRCARLLIMLPVASEQRNEIMLPVANEMKSCCQWPAKSKGQIRNALLFGSASSLRPAALAPTSRGLSCGPESCTT